VTTATFHSDPTDVYDPADGEIETIAFSLDFLEIVNPTAPGIFSGMGFGWALEQDGFFFGQTPFVTSNKIGWTNVSDANPAFGGPFSGDLDALVATDFPGPGFPDFSTSGSPITFGFFTTNTSGGGEVSGFDNFSTTLNKVGIAGDSGANSARLRDGDTDLGIANEWSVMLWAAPSNLAPVNTETLFEIHTLDGGDDSNAFRIDIDSTGTIDFRLFSLTGTLMKSYQMDALDDLGTPGRQGFFFEENQWAQIVVTWLGSSSSLKVYRNGVLMNSDMDLVADLIGDQGNTNRSLSLGARVSAENAWAGFMHSAALWNSELSASDIRVLWNQGAGSNVQLHTGQDDYLADRDLESWWRLGFSCTEPLIDHTSASRDLSPTGPTGPTGAP